MIPPLGPIAGLSLPWLAAGAVGASLPVIAHLVGGRGGRRLPLPTARFALDARKAAKRRTRLRDALLMLLRALAVVLLAMTFDQPTLSVERTAPAAPATDLVVIVDASASMRRADRGRALFERARDEALGAVASLPPGARAGVIFARATPTAALPALTTNHDALLDALGDAEATAEPATMRDAIALAVAMVEPGEPCRLLICSDAQATTWAGVEPADAAPFASVSIADVAPGDAQPNTAITDLRLDAGRPLATVRSTVPGEVAVEFRAGGRRAVASAAAQPGVSATVRSPLEAGAGVVEARLLDPDSFPLDDRRWLVVPPARAPVATIVTREPSSPAVRALRAALVATGIEVETLAPDALADLYTDLIVVAETGELEDRAMRVLLEADASLLWIVGSDATRASAVRHDELVGPERRLPLRFTGDAPSVATLDGGRVGARLIEALGARAVEALDGLAIQRVDPARARVGAEVWLATGDGGPVLAVSGSGRAAAFASALDPGSAELARTPLLPVILSVLAERLLPDRVAPAPTVVGRTATVIVPIGFTLPLRDERGRALEIAPVGSDRVAALVPSSDEPGVAVVRDGAGEAVESVAFAPDPRESEQGVVDPALFERDAPPTDETGARVQSEQVALWPWLALGVLAALIVESLLATRRKGGVL